MKGKKLISMLLVVMTVILTPLSVSYPAYAFSNDIETENVSIDSTSSFSNNVEVQVQKTYPTSWVYMANYSYDTSAKLKKATKAIVVASIVALFPFKSESFAAFADKVAGIVLGAAGTQFFVNSDTQDTYYFVKYYYRETGPGRYDSIGNFLGDYEIMKTVSCFADYDLTKFISSQTTTKQSTILEPWF